MTESQIFVFCFHCSLFGSGSRLADASYDGGGTSGTDAAAQGENTCPAYALNGEYGALLLGDGLFIVARNDDKSAFGFISAGKGRGKLDKTAAFWL